MKTNELILIRGITGSGKSTYAKDCYPRHIHLEADMFFINEDGEYRYDPHMIKYAHEWCFQTAAILLRNGKSVVVSNTFTRIWEMEKYIYVAKKVGINFNVIRMNNEFKNTHNVPNDVIQSMKDRFEDYVDEIVVKNG